MYIYIKLTGAGKKINFETFMPCMKSYYFSVCILISVWHKYKLYMPSENSSVMQVCVIEVTNAYLLSVIS
jgi:hypothetical protein